MNMIRSPKLLVTLIVITICALIWQIVQIFSNQNIVSAASATPVTTTSAAVLSPQAPKSKLLNEKYLQNPLITKMTQQIMNPNNDDLPPEGLSIASANQSEYLAMVNEYQIAQLERMLAEEKAAIAIAKRNAAQAEAQTAKYLGEDAVESNDPTAHDNTHYHIKYVDFQNNRWSAILERGGHYLEVKMGDVLPDGSKITAINNAGVTLQTEQESLALRFTNADHV